MKFHFYVEIEPMVLVKVMALIAFTLKVLTQPRIQPKRSATTGRFWFIQYMFIIFDFIHNVNNYKLNGHRGQISSPTDNNLKTLKINKYIAF